MNIKRCLFSFFFSMLSIFTFIPTGLCSISSSQLHKLIIIGSGPAGLTAGIYAGRAQLKPLIIEGNKPGGKLTGTTYIENWPGEKHILGYSLMMNMRNHAQAAGCNLIDEVVVNVNFKDNPFAVTTDMGNTYYSQAIIIATGSNPRRIGCPGEDDYWGSGVSSCVTCDGALYRDKKVIIVGGGDTGMEYASFLAKYTNQITIIQDLPELTASAPMQQRILSNPHIAIHYNSLVTQMHGDGQLLTKITITNQKTGKLTTLDADGVFLAIGNVPATDLFKNNITLGRGGYIKVVDQVKTSIPGVFAAGDVIDHRYRQAITSAGCGCMAALETERYLINNQKHRYIFAKNPI